MRYQGQVQYALINSLLFEKAVKRIERDKTGMTNICMAFSNESDNDDIGNAVEDEGYVRDREIDDGDGMLDNGDALMKKMRVFHIRLFEYFLLV